MAGLMLKDVYTIKRQMKYVVLILVAYTGIAIYSKNTQILAFIAVFVNIGLFFGVFGFDEKSNWEKYERILPVSIKTSVVTRYLEIVILNSILAIFFSIMCLFIQTEEVSIANGIAEMAAVLSTGMLVLAIMTPIIYKVGLEKARVVIIILAFGPVLLVVLLKQLKVSVDIESILANPVVNGMVNHLYIILPVLALIVLGISLVISIHIVNGKEY